MTTPPDAAHPTPPAPLDGARLDEFVEMLEFAARAEEDYAYSNFDDTAKQLRALAAALPGLLDRQRDARDAERTQLLRFAGMAFKAVRGDGLGGDWFGGDVEDAMESCGLLAPHRVTEACDPETCVCVEYGFPTTCYRATALGQSAIDAARTPSPEAPR